MTAVLRVLAFLGGSVVVLGTIASALKTVVVPRAEPVLLARWVFVTIRRPFDFRVRRAKTWEDADRIMARFAPFSLMTLPLVWVALVIAGFMPIYWALGVQWPGDSFEQSGSSLLTLGFAVDHHTRIVVAMFVEATIGLGLVALLISFLPTMYQLFSRRETLVSQLDVRAGTPPTPVAMFRRAKTIGWIDYLDGFWLDWERWFTEVEESHTSYLALSFFRSPHHQRSWITAAGAVLDAAALRVATMDLPRSWQAQLCLRSGYLALRRIAGAYDIRYDPDPAPTDPISITREEFDDVCNQLAELHVPMRDDRDQAWRDFAGWRVNYDTALLALCGLLMAPYSPWSADRGINYRVRLLPQASTVRRLSRTPRSSP
ncbi:MAG TPA: hypothetical protein VH479_14685 [Acidimicrobiales bacterium]|jgi:hypothetical protein